MKYLAISFFNQSIFFNIQLFNLALIMKYLAISFFNISIFSIQNSLLVKDWLMHILQAYTFPIFSRTAVFNGIKTPNILN